MHESNRSRTRPPLGGFAPTRHFVLGATVALGALLSLAAFDGTTDTRAETTAPRASERYEGTISQYRLRADGSIVFELAARTPRQARVWFRSPATRNSNTRFEEQLLEVILDVDLDGPVTVQGESDAANSGKRPDDAIDIGWIGRQG